MHSFAIKTARAGDLIMTAGGSGTIAEQIAAILAGVGQEGAGVLDLALLRVFYRHDAFSAAELMQSLAQALPAGTGCALTLVPVARAGAGDGLLAIEAVAVRGSQGQVRRDVGNRPFLTGVRRGQFLFLGAVTGVQADGIVAESTSVMQQLGATLQALGAGFADVVRMNRWYHAAGTKAEWEPSARAVAAFYAEPGPIATAISLPVPLPAARSIQIELMGMIGEDGRSLPKRHSWPEGLWDWPIHLPYKHGLACGGLGFVGGQVSLDAQAQVIDPDHPPDAAQAALAAELICAPIPVACTDVLPCAAMRPVLLMLPWLVRRVSAWAYTVPLLLMAPVAVTCTLPVAWMVPLLLSQPLWSSTNSPALAPILPALRTPNPASVPTRVILLAYMPPRADTTSAYAGAVPTPVVGAAWL